jgi:hypothetical protein
VFGALIHTDATDPPRALAKKIAPADQPFKEPSCQPQGNAIEREMEDTSMHEGCGKQPPPLTLLDNALTKRPTKEEESPIGGSAGDGRLETEGQFADIDRNQNGEKNVGEYRITAAVESGFQRFVFVVRSGRANFLHGLAFGFVSFGQQFDELIEYPVRIAPQELQSNPDLGA